MTDPITIATGVQDIVVRLRAADRRTFDWFIDCNMATAWVGDRFRIFPGKYGEDPLWGAASELGYADGATVAEAFAQPSSAFTRPVMPPNVPPGTAGLHGAVWFESIYQDPADPSGRTLYALYHNENYPETLPFDPATGEGYRDEAWPPGLGGDDTVQAVPRIGIMHSTDGGERWQDRGLLLEDRDERMIRLPVNRNYCFPGGVGDPSAVADGEFLYVFFGEYAYPTAWDAATWDRDVEAAAQCISVARVPLAALDAPTGAARRWDGRAFAAPWDGPGAPIASLRIPREEGGGAVSQGDELYHWGPSVSWNEDLQVWVMVMGRVDGPFWAGDSLYLSINPHRELGEGDASQRWSTPVRIIHRPGHKLWYPSLQPTDSPVDLAAKRTSLRLGREARLWFKDGFGIEGVDYQHIYISDFVLELGREGDA
mgnify:CR=1 FL=1